MSTSDLLALPCGHKAVITEIKAEEPLRSRLLDLGFLPGAEVAALFAAPSGSPRAYGICGTVIALRGTDAATILIGGMA